MVFPNVNSFLILFSKLKLSSNSLITTKLRRSKLSYVDLLRAPLVIC